VTRFQKTAVATVIATVLLVTVGVIVRAYAYIRSMGPEGLAAVSRAAIVNANYLMKKVDPIFPVAKAEPCMHEFVSSLAWTREHGVKNIDVAKRLLDYGFHAPTVSWPVWMTSPRRSPRKPANSPAPPRTTVLGVSW